MSAAVSDTTMAGGKIGLVPPRVSGTSPGMGPACRSSWTHAQGFSCLCSALGVLYVQVCLVEHHHRAPVTVRVASGQGLFPGTLCSSCGS